ncbi:GNAT family N-acetyltransferase [uncultured Tateyamaria sp.]|uniref:GNAT family N-acetyltransferase n=1 Tax=uncultured Tateyamaria sp. TaxID=455651 RepID=UPI00260AE254|nr:GNAT family N-acetyltransferase [uncultured Tateyamaria sp.]
MPDLYETRDARTSDIPALAVIADATLFPGEMLGDMMAPALTGEGDDIWRVVCKYDTPVGFAFAQPEAMTQGTWNLRAIATDPAVHGSGAGTALLAAVEAALGDARLLVIDTTQTEDQARARRFYAARGCTHVATIPGFFGPDEDKVTFIKTLT